MIICTCTYFINGQLEKLCDECRERKENIYKTEILPKYNNDPDKVPAYLKPDWNEGWKS
ncbi:hypothetical protein YTPLAS21_19330 [Candidatus Nitrosocosmicus sp.]|nr:hypothetical protein YTPLAS21_19330 [Candidatus Nitrosocosmicus sp.]